MAKKSTVKKAAAKKPAAAAKKKASATKPAGKAKPKPAPAKPAPKPASKPAAKPTPKASPKPVEKAAPKAATKAVKPATKPTPQPAPVPAKSPIPVPVIDVNEEFLDEILPLDLPIPAVAAKAHSAPLHKTPISPLSLNISAQSSAGAAANGNTHPANILVIVTCGGSPVTDLSRDHFTLMEHFDVPGQLAPFSNNITSFRNAGTGAYLLQTKPITGAPWRTGHHLAQILVSSPDDHQGQVAVKLVIR